MPEVFLIACAGVVATAMVLDRLHRLSSPLAWALLAVVLIAAFAARRRWDTSGPVPRTEVTASRWTRGIFLALAFTAAVAAAVNLVIVFGTTPASWDGLAYHLPRAALALQNGAFWRGPVNFWAQAAHPFYSTALFVFGAVVSGRNEHVYALWQIVGWFAATAAVRNIARQCGAGEIEAACAALLFFVLPQSIVQAAAVGNDMLLAAMTAIAADRLLRFAKDGRAVHLVWLSLALALGLGMKLSFVLQIAMLVVVAALAVPRARWRASLAHVVLTCATIVVLVLPSGYVGNIARWGTLVGPPDAVAVHTFADVGPARRIAFGLLNTARLATDFASLDGNPRVPPMQTAQSWLRRAAMAPFDWIGVDLTASEGARAGFLRDRLPLAIESNASWGVAGLLLLWPAVFAAAVRRREDANRRALAWGVVAFLVLQGFSGPYDPFRGRYFLSSGVLACPLAIRWIGARAPASRLYVAAALGLTLATALWTTVFRSAAPLVTVHAGGTLYPSILTLDRPSQLARNRRGYGGAFAAVERMIPETATVAVWLPPDSFEYPLFGPRLRRTILPVGGRPLDDPALAGAGYLVFSQSLEAPRAGDRPLGADWWVRDLRAPRALTSTTATPGSGTAPR